MDELIDKSDVLLADEDWSHRSEEATQASILANRLEAAVTRLTIKGSVYTEQLGRGKGLVPRYRLQHNWQVAVSLRDDLNAGWTETVVELVHADTYSDYLEMADALLNKGYKDAAAVITGTSLEVHVRALCVKNNLTTAVAGKPKKADTMNADLKKAGVYDGLRQKQITAWMDLRNKAAHGDYADYDEDQVRLFIDGVRSFMMKYPA
ncbi:hypothetical protein RM780_22400 [Streptomyces sp. DSM 44917]|uniref:DUF4145 domain-containing protein n=1 Tax=Streptomyces boetiae TaxID=3075541 RepID=A0ABU2LDW2_9ACTN|nr:hypothetical protein [Streptomyces sp. DSM 44917]MDT0309687.1 hypothetical protein [Streptomyces sp. DSM 44917]